MGEVILILYLIRHGQSVANESGIIQGHKQFPLSENRQKQAKLLGDFCIEID
ncbi:phosphoglycerate mutase family protein [Anaerobacillus sp. HL2]|nr:phosphoglycerate mutase family protein [Anaerobacillus sp. HL2]